MIDLKDIRNKIVSELYGYVGEPVVNLEQVPKKPPYPFIGYKFTSPYIQARGQGNITTTLEPSTDDRFQYDVVERLDTQPTMTLSISAYSRDKGDDIVIAHEVANKAMEWFKHSGYMYLSDNNIVVVSVEAIGDRTILMGDLYEVRYGFDVILRVTDSIDLRYETIEEFNINKEFD